MPELLWEGPEHGDGDTLPRAFRRVTGRDFDPGRCVWEEVAAGWTRYVFRDVEVTVRWDGGCSISRTREGGGG